MKYWTPRRASERTDNTTKKIINRKKENNENGNENINEVCPNTWEIASKNIYRKKMATIKRFYTRNSFSETITVSINQHKSTLSDSYNNHWRRKSWERTGVPETPKERRGEKKKLRKRKKGEKERERKEKKYVYIIIWEFLEGQPLTWGLRQRGGEGLRRRGE